MDFGPSSAVSFPPNPERRPPRGRRSTALAHPRAAEFEFSHGLGLSRSLESWVCCHVKLPSRASLPVVSREARRRPAGKPDAGGGPWVGGRGEEDATRDRYGVSLLRCTPAHPAGFWVRCSCGSRVLSLEVSLGDRQDAAGGGGGQVHAGEGKRCPGAPPIDRPR